MTSLDDIERQIEGLLPEVPRFYELDDELARELEELLDFARLYLAKRRACETGS